MSFNAAALKVMLEKGLTLGDVAEIAEANERRRDLTGAERQARFRKRKASNAVTVTPLSPNDNSILTPEVSEPNGSSPQPWACPPGADPAHWRDLMKNRKTKRLTNSETAYLDMLKDLARIADDEWPPGELVRHAAAKGWGAIYDPRISRHGERSDTGKRPSGWEAAYHANMGSGGHG